MSVPAEDVTLRLPRALVAELPAFLAELTDRMHTLMERNIDGALSPIECAELETLVRMAQFAQLLSLAAEDATAT